MLEFNANTELLSKKHCFFPARRIVRRPTTSCKNFKNPRNQFLYPTQKIQIVTNSNFIVKKHKPIANPFTEFSFSTQTSMNKSKEYRSRLNTLNPLKERLSILGRKKNLQMNSSLKREKQKKNKDDTICGWGKEYNNINL